MTDFARYTRQVVLPEVGVHGQQLLRDSTALIVGLGGLGSPASLYLAAAGLGRLLLSDREVVEPSNLQRQVLYSESDVGKSKTAAAAARLAALNPEVELVPFEGRLTPAKLDEMVREADVVLDCTDNFPTRFAINAACVRGRRPLLSGAALGFGGQLACFDRRQPGGPCYACLYPEDGPPQERCEDAGILGPVAGTIGTLQAVTALQLLLGHDALVDELLHWDATQMTFRRHKVPPDPTCAACARSR